MRAETKEARRIHVVADDRERGAGVGESLAQNPRVSLRWDRLAVGDFAVDDRLLVERKTLLDFAVSVVDGRLFTQCGRLAESRLCPVLILEGSAAALDGRAFSRESLLGATVAVSLLFGVPILRTLSPGETAHLIVLAAAQVARVEAGRIRRPGYRPRSRRGRQCFLLQGLPGTGPVLADRLLRRFGSVAAVVSASESALQEVEGIGVERATAIHDAVSDASIPYLQNKLLTYHDMLI